jgi:hypothetical protein
MMILNESKRDDLLLPYVDILNAKGIKCTSGILKKWLLKHLTENGGLRNLSLASNFYLAGAARYYFNGDLTQNKNLAVFDETNGTTDVWKEDICKRLNALILILRNGVIDSVGETFEQPEDFGELSLPKLLRKYGAKINKALGIVPDKQPKEVVDTLERNENVGNGYTFEILYSFGDATKYEKPTYPGSWCITYREHYFKSYIRNLGIHYVIFRKNGFESVPRVKGPDWTSPKPQDEYGCSLIALLQSNTNGEPIYITSRWNHGHDDSGQCEADHAFTKEEFFQKTGVTDADLQRIFEIWQKDKPKKSGRGGQDAEAKEEKLRVLRCFKYAQMRINGGENPDSVLIKETSTDPQELEIIRNRSKMVLVGNGKPMKSIIVYKSTIADTPYFVMVDRGKILFDTITSEENYSNYRWNRTFDYTDLTNENGGKVSEFKWLKNAIVVSLPNERYMIYDIRKKNFVNIGGTTKFKYLNKMSNTWNVDIPVFYEIKMSNTQIALVDVNTNTPLMLPNGEYWFEEISYPGKSNYWGRGVKTHLIDKKSGMLLIVYETAALTRFIYDINRKKFLDINLKEFSGRGSYIKSLKDVGLVDCYVVGSDPYEIREKACKIIKGDDTVSIGGKTIFGNIQEIAPGYLKFTYNGKNYSDRPSFLWSLKNESYIYDINGEPIQCDYHIFKGDFEDKIFYIKRSIYDFNEISYSDPSQYIYTLFLPSLNAILKNPLDGSDLFILGRYGANSARENILVFKDETDNEGTSFNINELIRNKSYINAVVPGSAKLEIVSNNANNQTDNSMELSEHFSITNADIRNMVYEAVNKILKK